MNVIQLIQDVKKGNPKAEKKLYQYCYENCFKITLIYCEDKTESTAVFNHAILSVFNHLDQIKDPQGFLRWVSRIVKNDCIDHIRKKTVYRNKLMVLSEQKSSETAFNKAISSLAMDDILKLINQLKPDFRLCFILFAIDGYAYKEIAKELDININTAKWYVREARKVLQKQLVNLGYHKAEKNKYGFKG